MIGSLIFGVFSLVFCVLFCWFRAEKPTVNSLILKTTSSISFILCGVFALNSVGSSNINLLMIVGLVLGLIGDIILDLKVMYPEQADQYFVFGTCSFAVGHFFYFMSAVLYNSSVLPSHLLWNILISLGVAIILTLAIMLSSKKLKINFGKMIYIAAFYCLVLTFMVSFTISIAIFVPIYWIVAVGMLFFFISDLILSMQYFGGRDEKVWIYLNHILYYLAQVILAVSILYVVV